MLMVDRMQIPDPAPRTNFCTAARKSASSKISFFLTRISSHQKTRFGATLSASSILSEENRCVSTPLGTLNAQYVDCANAFSSDPITTTVSGFLGVSSTISASTISSAIMTPSCFYMHILLLYPLQLQVDD